MRDFKVALPPTWAAVAYALVDEQGRYRSLPSFAPRAHVYPVEEARRRAVVLAGCPRRSDLLGLATLRWKAWLHVGVRGRRREVTADTESPRPTPR